MAIVKSVLIFVITFQGVHAMDGVYRMRDVKKMRHFLNYQDRYGSTEYIIQIDGKKVKVIFLKTKGEAVFECDLLSQGDLFEIVYKNKRRQFEVREGVYYFSDSNKFDPLNRYKLDGELVRSDPKYLSDYIELLRQEHLMDSDYP